MFAWVEDLELYPRWLSIVPSAQPDTPRPGDQGIAWRIDLRGRIGPVSRSKRLRMVRTRHDPPNVVVFERAEHDGHDHAPWVLRATVTPEGDGSKLTMHLHYGGRLWEPIVERMLRDEIEASRGRLLALVGSPAR